MNSLYNLKGILYEAIEKNGTDINITTDEKLCFRINGDIVLYDIVPTKTIVMAMVDEITSSNKTKIDIFRGEEADGSYVLDDKYFFRYNISLSNMRVHMSIRKLIDQVPDFETIQLNDDRLKTYIDKMCNLDTGLFLLVGATGSGKTTTIVTLLDYLMKQNSIKVISLESPIEYYFNSENYPQSIVLQKEIGKDTLSFYSGLVAAMRQNPDVIFVGEIRDKATAEAALQASLTGHQVVATLHAKSIEKTRERMEYLLDGVTNDFDFIQGIIFQKLSKENGKIRAYRDVWTNENLI